MLRAWTCYVLEHGDMTIRNCEQLCLESKRRRLRRDLGGNGGRAGSVVMGWGANRADFVDSRRGCGELATQLVTGSGDTKAICLY